MNDYRSDHQYIGTKKLGYQKKIVGDSIRPETTAGWFTGMVKNVQKPNLVREE